jgi:predicted O-linked N-acetylglucosamine transferase (SPINDLY family)
VQVGHLVGLGQTSGMSAMDYVLTDSWVTGAECGAHYSEIPYRLDRCFLSFRPLPEWPAVTPSPACRTGHVTFGSLNNPSRITPETIDAWAEILRRTEGARLILVHGFFRDESIRARLSAAFEAHGLGDRIAFDAVERGWPAGMEVYETLDIALDTFPMNGGSTTYIAMWMGLPVLTLVGETSLSRHGLSFLSAMGLEQDAAPDTAAYVARAVALADDKVGLAGLRAGLRERIAASPLLDHDGLARAVEAAYRDMWIRWCALSPSKTYA